MKILKRICLIVVLIILVVIVAIVAILAFLSYRNENYYKFAKSDKPIEAKYTALSSKLNYTKQAK